MDHPLQLTKTKWPVREKLDRRRERALERRTDQLLLLQGHWAQAAQRALRSDWQDTGLSWQEFADQTPGRGDNEQSLGHASYWLAHLEGLNNGFPEVWGMHASKHRWFFEDVPYQMDCTLLLMKLLNNMRWAREQNEPLLVNEMLGFPLLNYVSGRGPTYPAPTERFGINDQHIVVSMGELLVYWVPTLGTDSAYVLKIFDY